MRHFQLFIFFLGVFVLNTCSTQAATLEVELPSIILSGINAEITVKLDDASQEQLYGTINGKAFYAEINNGTASIPYTFSEKEIIVLKSEDFVYEKEVNPIPLWLSILPPFLAIFMALLFKEVITSLFIGIVCGALTIHIYAEGSIGIITGFMSVIETYVMGALNDWGHLAVITFSTLIGGMVAVISKNGGMQGVVDKLSIYAKNARSGQFVTWLLGVLIFFDDYANTLIVGNTMRPLTDRHRISREKLSYIVDSTAAPIAAIAFITTWIGAELGYIQDGIKHLTGIDQSAYSIFLHSLQFSFYPIFTLLFILMLIWKSKDYGPMLQAERRARNTSPEEIATGEQHAEIADFMPDKNTSSQWYNAVIPVGVVILGTIAGLFYTGWDAEMLNQSNASFLKKLSMIIGNSDSYKALLWSSMTGLIAAVLLSVGKGIMNLTKTLQVTMSGFKTMLNAIVILILAWSLALITEHLHTADFITGILSQNVQPAWIPAITFLLAALVAFSTGSSWGTMAILYPLMLPACWKISLAYGMSPDEALHIFYNVVSTVLAGAVLGDHCSPISDTTILSSLASSCNHIDHVRTQLPYALTVGFVALLAGTIPSSYGFPTYLSFLIGLLLLYLIIRILGKESQPKLQQEQ